MVNEGGYVRRCQRIVGLIAVGVWRPTPERGEVGRRLLGSQGQAEPDRAAGDGGVDGAAVLGDLEAAGRGETEGGLADGSHQRAPGFGREVAGGVGGADGLARAPGGGLVVEEGEDGLFELHEGGMRGFLAALNDDRVVGFFILSEYVVYQ